MKTKNILISALLALAAVASAQASTVTAGLNDVVLGFNKGTSANLDVDLGNISSFKTGGTYATGSEVFLSTLLNVADLNATYGSGTGSAGWKSSATSWAVVGTNGAGLNTLWGTQVNPETPGSSQGTGVSAIATIYNAMNGQTSTANSAVATVLPSGNPDSFKTQSSGNFGYWGSTNFKNNSALASAGPVVLNFYEYVQGAATTAQLGTFKLYSDGGFSYTSFAAIPEPSTYAAILGVATLGFAALRRRKQALVA